MNPQGRAPLPTGEARTVIVQTRLKPAEAKDFKELSAELGITPSEVMRQALEAYALEMGVEIHP